MKAWRAKWSAEYPNLPAGRPNIFDVLAYADMYVLAEALEGAGKDLTTAKFNRRAREHPRLSGRRDR